jgi:periplasmic iron binding protein
MYTYKFYDITDIITIEPFQTGNWNGFKLDEYIDAPRRRAYVAFYAAARGLSAFAWEADMRGFFAATLGVVAVGIGTLGFAPTATTKEYPIGKPHTVQAAGMEVAAVYLQPVEMEPAGMMRPAKDSDVHLEADIKALKGNKNGYAEGDWIGYLGVKYELTKLDDGKSIKGDFMAMVANDGPHYGDNVKLMGVGKYKLKLTISPPGGSHGAHFGRHVDKETGVAAWFKTFSVEYDFIYAGAGKKGTY